MHRPFHFALVDEADSLMIDEARVPLVIAGQLERDAVSRAAPGAARGRPPPGVHFDSDEYGRDIELTEAGIEHVERALGCGNLHRVENLKLLTELNCALHAHVLLRRDVDYIVRERAHRDRRRVHGPRRGGSALARRPAGRARGQGGPRAPR